jgi:hypothetical protein
MATPPLGVNAAFRPYRLVPVLVGPKIARANSARVSDLYSPANNLRKSNKLLGLTIVTAFFIAAP